MQVSEILALINAGYTKEEIAQFSKAQEQPKEKEPEKTKEKEPEQTKEKEPEQTKEKEPEEKPDPLKDLTTVVAGLAAQVKAMQNANIDDARQKEPEKENANSVIKSFIEKM